MEQFAKNLPIAELIAEKLNLNLVRAPHQSPVKALPIAHSIKLDL